MTQLTKYGTAPFLQAHEATMRGLFNLTIRPPKKIKVTGYSPEQEITVQVREDGILTHCNHGGAEIDVIDTDLYQNGEFIDVVQTAIACDKCVAWQDESGEWYE